MMNRKQLNLQFIDKSKDNSTDKSNNDICGICLDKYNLPVKLPNCTHIFCFLCIKSVSASSCPLCRARITNIDNDFTIDKDTLKKNLPSRYMYIWQYAGRNFGHWNYDPITNDEIESKYSEYVKDNNNNEIRINIGPQEYMIDFNRMIQYPIRYPDRERCIKREKILTRKSLQTNQSDSKGTAGLKDFKFD